MMKADAGIYRAQAVEWDLGYTSGGKEQVAVRFRLLDVDDGNPYVTWYGFFTEKTTDRTLDSLRHCGWTGDYLGDLSGMDANEVDLVLEWEEDQHGEYRLRVRWVNSRGGLALKERMSDGDKQAFAQRMKGKVLAHKQTRAPRQNNTAQTARGGGAYGAPPFEKDDIPF